MPERPDSDSTTAPSPPSSPQNELTRSYVPPQAEAAAGDHETQLRRTGGEAEARGQSIEDAPLRCVGRYAILGEIGRGGMGVVLEADDPQLRRHLAVKVLQEQYQHDPRLVRRFLDEARICGQLQHPGIVPIHEIGRLCGAGKPTLPLRTCAIQKPSRSYRKRKAKHGGDSGKT